VPGGTSRDGDTARPLRRLGIALIGGFRASGRLRVTDRLVRVSLIGGVDLDLTEAEFTAPRFAIVKVSLIGGVDLRVPSEARITVHGFAIGGRDLARGNPPRTAAGPEIVVYSYGILGGIKVRRCAPPSGGREAAEHGAAPSRPAP
jgi:hypothetical protein